MKSEIPADPILYNKIVQQVSLRMQASAAWYSENRERWERCYSRWRTFPARPESIGEEDPYEIKLGYGFGLLEQITSKITEPMLEMGIPFGIFPTEDGDQPKADNFADMARDFYSKPNVQMGKRKSKKEMVITGSRWEIDEWLHVEVKGKRWGKISQKIQVPVPDKTGKPQMDADGKPVMAEAVALVDGEVPAKIVTHYGFNTRYPSVQDVYPEPNRTTIDTGQKTDVSWIVEDMGELALEDMMREVIYDPDKKQTRPRYDFSKLIDAAGPEAKLRYAKLLDGSGDVVQDAFGPLITPIHDWVDFKEKNSLNRGKSTHPTDAQSFEDRDKVWVAQMRTSTMIVTVVQGKYLIEVIQDPWHRPRLGARVENYTVDPRSIFGPGAMDPILDELDELDITHSLGMQNLFRLVNKMIAVKEKAVASLADFNPRGGGIVRVNDEVGSAAEAVHPIDTPSAINEMLAGESNIKASIEFTSSNHDNSPGIRNNRRGPKTATEVEALSVNVGTRFATMQAQALINEALSGESMEYMVSQFMWEPVSYSHLSEDGSTVYAKFTKDDIDTNGRGFRYRVTVDPLWGNSHVQRQDALDIFNSGVQYMELFIQLKDPTMKKVDLSELYGDMLKKSGRRDLSKIFYLASGEVSPQKELQVLMGGGIVDGCKGDLREHITAHLLQAGSPNLAKAIEAQKAAPDTVQNLQRLVLQATAQMRTFLKDPQAAAAEKLNDAGMQHPGEMPS